MAAAACRPHTPAILVIILANVFMATRGFTLMLLLLLLTCIDLS